MGGFRRTCLFVFGLVGIFALAVGVLPWFGPWQDQVIALYGHEWFRIVVKVCAGLAAAGLLFEILRAIFTPRRRRKLVVMAEGSDKIEVTDEAISAQAKHLIEEDGAFEARRVRVTIKGHKRVDLYAKVRPLYTVSVVERGSALYEDLVEGMKVVCGDKVGHVTLEFVGARSFEELEDEVPDGGEEVSDVTVEVKHPVSVAHVSEETDAPAAQGLDATEPEALEDARSQATEDSPEMGIRVPMGHVTHKDDAPADEEPGGAEPRPKDDTPADAAEEMSEDVDA